MSTPFIPSEDGAALTWMTQFSAGISSSPATYMCTPSDATTIANAVGAFHSAYIVATNNMTRSPANIITKDQTRTAAEIVCRQYAGMIRQNDGISDSDKNTIGVRPINTERNPINVPASSPIVSVIGATQGAQTIRYSDTTTPDSPAKPFGAQNIQLFCTVADEPATDPNAARFIGAYTKNPIGVTFQPADNGKMATWFARWADRKGQVGPWSTAVSFAIAA